MYPSVLLCNNDSQHVCITVRCRIARQALLEDRDTNIHKKTNKQTHIHTKTFIKKNIHIGTSIQSLFAFYVKDHGFSPSPIKIDFKIGIWWFSNKLTTLREKSYNKTINYSLWCQ
jgi:hypothetical protein